MKDESPPRPIAASLVLLGCASVAAAHLVVLYTSGQSPVTSPVSTLSRGVDGNLHGLGLSLFAMAQLALAALLHRADAGWPTRLAELLLAVDAVLIVYLAYRFATVPDAVLYGSGANDPLWLLASVTGLVMALVTPGLLKRHRPAAFWNLACFALWLALMPLYFAVDPSWIGVYQRLVGGVFVAWMVGMAVLIGFTTPSEAG